MFGYEKALTEVNGQTRNHPKMKGALCHRDHTRMEGGRERGGKSCILCFGGIKRANLGGDGFGVRWFFLLSLDKEKNQRNRRKEKQKRRNVGGFSASLGDQDNEKAIERIWVVFVFLRGRELQGRD